MWALANRGQFPVDLNHAPRELLLRVPGLGVKSVLRIVQTRRVRRLRTADLLALHVPLKKILPFVIVVDHQPGAALDATNLVAQLRPAATQAGLFDEPAAPTLPDFGARTAPPAPAQLACPPTAAAHLPEALSAMGGNASNTRSAAWV